MTAQFDHDIAVVIGIDDYTNVRPLTTAVADATRLAAMLADEHGYDQVYILTSDIESVTKKRLADLFNKKLLDVVGPGTGCSSTSPVMASPLTATTVRRAISSRRTPGLKTAIHSSQ